MKRWGLLKKELSLVFFPPNFKENANWEMEGWPSHLVLIESDKAKAK